jgi:hypothetical protein
MYDWYLVFALERRPDRTEPRGGSGKPSIRAASQKGARLSQGFRTEVMIIASCQSVIKRRNYRS